MYKKNVYIAGFFIALMAFLLYYTNTHIHVAPINLDTVNSRSVPNILCVGILAMNLVLLATSWKKANFGAGQPPSPEEKSKRRLVVVFMAVFAGYILLIPLLGFFTSTAAFLVLLFVRLKVRATILVPVVVLALAFLWVMFIEFMMVPLPRGLLI